MLSATAPTIFSKKNIDRHLNHIELMVSLPRCLLRCAETVFSWSRHHLSVEKVLRWGKWLVAWQTKSQNQGSVGQDPCNFLHFPLLVVRLARLWFLSAYKSSNFWTCQVVDPKRIEKHEDPWRLVADWMRAGLYLTFPKFLPLSDNFPPKKASNIQTRNSKKKKKKDQIIIPPNTINLVTPPGKKAKWYWELVFLVDYGSSSKIIISLQFSWDWGHVTIFPDLRNHLAGDQQSSTFDHIRVILAMLKIHNWDVDLDEIWRIYL